MLSFHNYLKKSLNNHIAFIFCETLSIRFLCLRKFKLVYFKTPLISYCIRINVDLKKIFFKQKYRHIIYNNKY